MNYQRYFSTIDTHIGGEPLRIITAGVPPILGETMIDKLQYFRRNFDSVRKILLQEPRGHGGMYGCVITAPEHATSDFGVLMMNNEGYHHRGLSVMSVAAAALETGLIAASGEQTKVVLDTPWGTVEVTAHCRNTEVQAVRYGEQPAFMVEDRISVAMQDRSLDVALVSCGKLYAVVDSDQLQLRPDIAAIPEWKRSATIILEQLSIQYSPISDSEISGVVAADFSDPAGSLVRCMALDREGALSRSADTTVMGACLALLHRNGISANGGDFLFEGLSGGVLSGRYETTDRTANQNAIVPVFTGRMFITGTHQFVLDPADQLREGFVLK